LELGSKFTHSDIATPLMPAGLAGLAASISDNCPAQIFLEFDLQSVMI
jgi:hypothetical protein